MSNGTFNAYGRYYDLLYRDKNYTGESIYIRSLLARNGVTNGEILEFGSGTGKHGRLLSDMGYKVHGIELSAEMVAEAHENDGFTCQQGDIGSIRMGRTYDAVISLFHVISYQTTNHQVLSVFSRAAEHLLPGGIFIFDFWYSPAVYSQQPAVRVKRMTDESVKITRIAEPVIIDMENRVDVQYEVYASSRFGGETTVFQETHSMRHFSIPEIDLLAQMTAFERVEAEEFLTTRPPSQDTWGVCVVLKKI